MLLCYICRIISYQIENKIFFKDDSAAEVGTTRATINRTGKTNAKKGAADYNSYKEFHEREVEGHVIASFMVYSGMHSMEGMFNFIGYYLSVIHLI